MASQAHYAFWSADDRPGVNIDYCDVGCWIGSQSHPGQSDNHSTSIRNPISGEYGGWQHSDLDLSEHFAKYRDHEVVVIIASVGKVGQVEREKYVCGICEFAMDELGECPRCKLQNQEAAKGLAERAFLREVDEFVRGKWDSVDQGDEDE